MSKTAPLTALLLCTMIAAGNVEANAKGKSHDDFYDRAKVVRVTSVYRQVPIRVSVRECVQRPVRYRVRNGRSYTPEILGGIVGGVVGNRFGAGHGKTVLSIAGAMLGASVGHDINRRMSAGGYRDEPGEECWLREDVRMERELDGYRIRYRYRGQEFTTFSDERPGKYIRVKVDVIPAEDDRRARPASYRDIDDCDCDQGKEYF